MYSLPKCAKCWSSCHSPLLAGAFPLTDFLIYCLNMLLRDWKGSMERMKKQLIEMSNSKAGIKSQLTKQLFLLFLVPSDTESTLITQNHRTGKVGRDHWRSSLSAQAVSPRACCIGLCPDSFWTSSAKETPKPLWWTCPSYFLKAKKNVCRLLSTIPSYPWNKNTNKALFFF